MSDVFGREVHPPDGGCVYRHGQKHLLQVDAEVLGEWSQVTAGFFGSCPSIERSVLPGDFQILWMADRDGVKARDERQVVLDWWGLGHGKPCVRRADDSAAGEHYDRWETSSAE